MCIRDSSSRGLLGAELRNHDLVGLKHRRGGLQGELGAATLEELALLRPVSVVSCDGASRRNHVPSVFGTSTGCVRVEASTSGQASGVSSLANGHQLL